MKNDNDIRRGSANLFADLGFADPELHLAKAKLVTRIRAYMHDQKLTQSAAAKQMGVSQPDLSRLLRGQFRDVSIERLMRMLARLGCEVDIVVHGASRTPPAERSTSIRLDPEIVAAMRARGSNWRTQLNAFLYQTYVKGERPWHS